MFIQFDEKNMHIQVICGTLEEYKPDESMTTIQTKLNDLKTKLEDFRDSVVAPALKEIHELVDSKNSTKA